MSRASDVVILDVMLPGLSGFEACRQLAVGPDLDPGVDVDRP